MNELDIFTDALELTDPLARNRFLEQACRSEPLQRQRIEALLRNAAEASRYLESPLIGLQPPSGLATNDPPQSEHPGTRIGPYKLLQQIGEGGMGVVWMAEQTHPVQRKVAVKVIKPGMDSRQVIARFEAERQAVALMDHVNIARVFDGGTTDEGRPYFVMELVHGVPITKYCDDNHLTLRQRLELFVPVCQAIQHAHQKGIIHRDIKPTNVMVTLYDGQPVPKIIDFGVAKATEQKLTERTLFTQYGTMVGTLEYMSPEQAEMSALGVDTRSDIYSLGVLLYELLTGTTPLCHKRMKDAAYVEILRMIKEEEPQKPSTRLSDSGEALASISANRHTEPAKLTKLVRGELDWIVMKTLEKDRNRRYETANGFAMDVQRYLDDEQVQACPPSVAYRLRKFARRNKAALGMTAAVIVSVVLLGSGVGWAVRDQAARQGRIGAQVYLVLGEVEQLVKEQKWPEALAVARRAEALTAGGADGATQERVRQVLNDLQMVARLEELRLREVHADQPGATLDDGRSDLYAGAFRDFGVDIEALPAEESTARLRARPAVAIALAAALDDWARVQRPKDREQSKRLWALATALDPDPWRVQVRQASAAMDVVALVKLANAPEVARQPPQSQLLLASSLQFGDQPEKALALLERACESHPGDFWIHYELAYNTTIRPDRTRRPSNSTPHDRVEAGIRHGIAARALRPRSANTWNLLGAGLRDQKKLDEAIAAFRKAIELDPKDAIAHNNLGIALRDQKKLNEAVDAHRKAIELDPKYTKGYTSLGIALHDQKKLDEAVAAHRKAIELDANLANSHNSLGVVLHDQKKLDDAIVCYKKAIELDPKSAIAYSNLGNALRDKNKFDEAIAWYKKAIELDPKSAPRYISLGFALDMQKKLDEAITCYQKAIELDPRNELAYRHLAAALRNQGKLDEGIAWYKKAIELDPRNELAYRHLAAALRTQRRLDEAIACYKKAIELDPKSTMAYTNLGHALRDQKKLDEAIAWYKKAIEVDPKSNIAYSNLGNALRDQKKLDEAIAWYKKAIEVDPKSAPKYISLGFALGMQKKLDEAVACFKKAIELDPKNELAYRNLAALGDQGKLDEVIAAFSKAVEINPGTVAGVHAQIKQMSKGKEFDALSAREDFKKLVADVEAKRPLNDRAWDLATDPDPSLRDPTRAVELAEKAMAELPKDANCWNTLGVARYRAGDYEGAVAALMKYRELRTNDAEWTNPFFLAMTHWKLDDKDEAAQWYKLAVEWMERKKANSEIMRRVRAEAAELLAVAKKKD